jgi:hypothetical protein
VWTFTGNQGSTVAKQVVVSFTTVVLTHFLAYPRIIFVDRDARVMANTYLARHIVTGQCPHSLGGPILENN